jgi:hypothetical protein|nr:hypothetical protein [Nitrosomonas nitrosa]
MSNVTPTAALIDECERQSENCGYTATSFIIWLRFLRWTRTALLVAPVIFGAIATWKILAQTSPISTAIFALLATVIPPVYRASRLDQAITDYETLAGEYTNLRDRFRQLARIAAQKPFPEFEAEAKPIIARLEKARGRALAPPDWTFQRARRKHKAGDYQHDYDQRSGMPLPSSTSQGDRNP